MQVPLGVRTALSSRPPPSFLTPSDLNVIASLGKLGRCYRILEEFVELIYMHLPGRGGGADDGSSWCCGLYVRELAGGIADLLGG